MSAVNGSCSPAFLAAEHAARSSYGRIMAILIAKTRDIASAEDALSEAFARALQVWPDSGVPQNPDAWLLTTARRLLIDHARHERMIVDSHPKVALATRESILEIDEDHICDDRLRMLFLTAHPEIDVSVRTPLMLQLAMGLDVKTIASAFLVSPTALAQRLVRVKAKIRDSALSFALPPKSLLKERLDSVIQCIYATFNAGWDCGAESISEGGLANEAIWLARELQRMLPDEPEVLAVLALMLFSHSRHNARRTESGEFVPFDQQDQRLWDFALIDQAEDFLCQAFGLGSIGRYQLEAAIQSAHSHRARAGDTDWAAIIGLYNELLRMSPSIGATVARAAAIGRMAGADEGLKALEAIDPASVAAYQPYWATKGHLLKQLGRHHVEMQLAFQIAAGLSIDPSVRTFLLGQIERHEGTTS